MLHAKIQDNWPTGSGEEDFLAFLNICEHGGHVEHATQILVTKFCSP